MPLLNAMFKEKSNAMFNNRLFTLPTIPVMHETAERLYLVAKAMKGISTQSPLASELNESPQTVNNWESRGVSAQGALKAQRQFGCDANWLLTGLGHVLAGWPFSPALLAKVLALDAEDRKAMEVAMWAHLREKPPESLELSEEPNLEDVQRFTRGHTIGIKPTQRKRAA